MNSNRSREYLTQPEIQRLLAASRTATRNPARDYAIVLLMFRHGLRVREMSQMKLEDVDIENREMHVEREKGSVSGPHKMFEGEAEAISQWLAVRGSPACDTLFISERKRPLARQAVFELIRKLGKAAGLTRLAVHPHMLRHSTGYDLVNRGTDIRTIQGYLGHKVIGSTVRYTHLDASRFANLFPVDKVNRREFTLKDEGWTTAGIRQTQTQDQTDDPALLALYSAAAVRCGAH